MKLFKILISVTILVGLLVLGRLYSVQSEIKKRPIEISDIAESGYTPPNVFGHGDFELDGGQLGWYVYDIPAENGMVRKICEFGGFPPQGADLDFVYIDENWFKLRTGKIIIRKDGFTIEPPTTKWKGRLTSRTAFPVRNPDWPYRAKILYSKIRHGNLSPLEYLQGLKASNPSCMKMPAP